MTLLKPSPQIIRWWAPSLETLIPTYPTVKAVIDSTPSNNTLPYSISHTYIHIYICLRSSVWGCLTRLSWLATFASKTALRDHSTAILGDQKFYCHRFEGDIATDEWLRHGNISQEGDISRGPAAHGQCRSSASFGWKFAKAVRSCLIVMVGQYVNRNWVSACSIGLYMAYKVSGVFWQIWELQMARTTISYLNLPFEVISFVIHIHRCM